MNTQEKITSLIQSLSQDRTSLKIIDSSWLGVSRQDKEELLSLLASTEAHSVFKSKSYTSEVGKNIAQNILNLISSEDKLEQTIGQLIAKSLYNNSQINIFSYCVGSSENKSYSMSDLTKKALGLLIPNTIGLEYLSTIQAARIIEEFEVNSTFLDIIIKTSNLECAKIILSAASCSKSISDEKFLEVIKFLRQQWTLDSSFGPVVLCRLVEIIKPRVSKAGGWVELKKEFENTFGFSIEPQNFNDPILSETMSDKQKNLYRDYYSKSIAAMCQEKLLPTSSVVGGTVGRNVSLSNSKELCASQANAAEIFYNIAKEGNYFLEEDNYFQMCEHWISTGYASKGKGKKNNCYSFFSTIGPRGEALLRFPENSVRIMNLVHEGIKKKGDEAVRAYFVYFAMLSAIFANKKETLFKCAKEDYHDLHQVNQLIERMMCCPQDSKAKAVVMDSLKKGLNTAIFHRFEINNYNNSLIDLKVAHILKKSATDKQINDEILTLLHTTFGSWCLSQDNQEHFSALFEMDVISECFKVLTKSRAHPASVEARDFILTTNLLKSALAKVLSNGELEAQNVNVFLKRINQIINICPEWTSYPWKEPLMGANGKIFYTAYDTIEHLVGQKNFLKSIQNTRLQWVSQEKLKAESINPQKIPGRLNKFFSLFKSKITKETPEQLKQRHNSYDYVDDIQFSKGVVTVSIMERGKPKIQKTPGQLETTKDGDGSKYESTRVCEDMEIFINELKFKIENMSQDTNNRVKTETQEFLMNYRALAEVLHSSGGLLDVLEWYSIAQIKKYFSQSLEIYLDSLAQLKAIEVAGQHNSNEARDLIEQNFLHQSKIIRAQCSEMMKKIVTRVCTSAQKQSRIHSALLDMVTADVRSKESEDKLPHVSLSAEAKSAEDVSERQNMTHSSNYHLKASR